MKLKSVTAVVIVTLFTAACTGHGPKETVGGLSGAALGGLLGAQFGSGTGKLATTGAGVLIGALVGSQIGKGLDDVDKLKANQAIQGAQVAPLNQTIAWNNPETGNSGTVTPVRDGTTSTGAYCREFQQTVTVGGKTEEAYGTACRQPDGSWQIVN